jgi:hypothetical protein
LDDLDAGHELLGPSVSRGRRREVQRTMALLLWIGAVILAVLGIIALLSGNILWGIVLPTSAATISRT